MKKLFFALLALLLALVSCKRIPLYAPESDVYLKININVQVAIHTKADDTPGMPEQIRAIFYSPDTHYKVAEELLPPEGGFVHVPSGTYDLILYSLGNDVTKIDGIDGRSTLRAYTRESGAIMKISKGGADDIRQQTVHYEPDHLYTATKENVVIPVRSEYDQTIVIEVNMETIVDTWTLEVRNIKGAEHISSVLAYLTGLAPAKYAWDYRLQITEPVAISFPLGYNSEKGWLQTDFNIFGRYSIPSNPSYVELLGTDTAGNQYLWVFNVTDQFENPDNTDHLIIIDEEVEFPDNPGDVGGFVPEVDEWGTIIIPINV